MIEILEQESEKMTDITDENITQLLKNINKTSEYDDFLVLILKMKYKTDFSKREMFGISGFDYILNACENLNVKVIDYDGQDDIIKIIKQNLDDKKYVLVLFSDTPLITKRTIYEILDYFTLKNLCALKFNRGFAFEQNYLRSVEKVYNPQEQVFNEEDFVKVLDEHSFLNAINILKKRILNYHMSNGVIIKDFNGTFIDAKTNIEGGVVIENNVVIRGKSLILKDSVISSNCCITNSIIESNCKIENSILENCVVKSNSQILDFSVIKNQTLEENTKLSNNKKI
ncbi:MAG: hypothetical protein ACI4T1_00885 [Christensenellales bacterium]